VFEPRDAADVAAFLKAAAAAGERVLVLGSGANLLVADEGVDAVVLHPVRLNSVTIDGGRVRAGAGTPLTELIARTTDVGLSGLEALAGIPAQVGGAVAMNAGGRWGWVSHVLVDAEVALPDGEAADAVERGARVRVPEGRPAAGGGRDRRDVPAATRRPPARLRRKRGGS
jgi:UDP-N-acetylenolpyruvoylglucosamine reductase